MLPDAPSRPVDGTAPSFGTYAGRCDDTELELADRGVGRLRRALSEKRWQWFGAFDADLAVGGAVVDAGPFGNAFLWVFDRAAERLLVDADVLVPSPLVSVRTSPGSGVLARIGVPRRRLRITRSGDHVAVDAHFGDADVSLVVDADGPTAATAICPVDGRDRGVNVTQKEAGLAANGTVSVRGETGGTRSLGGVAMLDYTHGLLARETVWSWAIGSCTDSGGTSVAFNLVDGFNDGLENVVWVDGEPTSVGEATVSIPGAGSGDDWRVRTDCGTVDVSLAVEGSREADVDVGLFASQYRQPLGAWSGTVDGREVDGVGVAERHRARW